MINPTIIYSSYIDNSHFFSNLPSGVTIKHADMKVNIPASTQTFKRFTIDQSNRGWVAVRHGDVWSVEDAQISIYSSYFSVYLDTLMTYEALAYPIDTAMTAADINGATRIYPNTTNTGWLFAHAELDDHHDRIIQLEAIMHTLFEDMVHENLDDVLKAVVGGNNPRPAPGTELLYTYNAQSGVLSNYQNIIEFRKECIKWCAEVEKLLHLGQHVQEDDHTLKHQLVRAIEQAKLIWNADTGKKQSLATILSQVNAIIARVETDHEIDTRWVKAAAAAAESESDSSDDNS